MDSGTTSPAEGKGSEDLHPEEAVIAEVRRALREIEFGSIVIKLHQGKVVGLETSTKRRLDA